MRERIDEKVSVVSFYSHKKGSFSPYLIYWQNREYLVDKIGYHNSVFEGRERHHIYELTAKEAELWMRLNPTRKTCTGPWRS